MFLFLGIVCALLAAALAYLVWSFWPVLGADYEHFADELRDFEVKEKAKVASFTDSLQRKSSVAPPAPLPTSKV